MQKKTNNKKIMTSLYIREDLKKELDKIAEKREWSFGHIVNKVVEEWLENWRKT